MQYVQQMLNEPMALMAIGLIALIAVILSLIASSGKRENAVEQKLQTLEQVVNDKFKAASDDADKQALKNREEFSANLRGMGDSVTRIMGEMSRTQQTQLDTFAGHIQGINSQSETRMQTMQQTIENRLVSYQDRMDRIGDVLDDKLQSNDQNMERLRESVEARMDNLQRDNSIRLQQIERTVDERLSTSIDQHLNESFRLVNERLERVYQGLGEMQSLAGDMGDLRRVLTTVRAKGMVGEIQLGAILGQLMAKEQYDVDVRIKPNGARCAYAVVLPGQNPGDANCLMPIDSSFPHELYDRMLDALDRGDNRMAEGLSERLEHAIREAAMRVAREFLYPPETTDFAVLFLGSEGLYAEILRRTGLVESLQREFHITLAGPSTLSALLSSIQMGIKTMMIERHSGEVWSLLGAVRGEMGTFATALQRTQKRIRQASESIDDAARKSSVIAKRLKGVDQFEGSSSKLLYTSRHDDVDDYDNSDWD